MLGLYGINNQEALEFIRARLNGTDRILREDSINAVERMPKDLRNGFAPDLLRIANDSSETAAIRAKAATVLTLQ